jgi:DNA segregation ATPase FtsK/SpoIIIE-like protein
MASTLTVSQIREALSNSTQENLRGIGQPSTAAMGRQFHQILAVLLGDDEVNNVAATLRDHDRDLVCWKQALIDHTYDRIMGPQLTQQCASFQNQGGYILNLWEAVQSACDMLAELWFTITDKKNDYPAQGDWFSAERQVVREVMQPSWSSPVAIVGQMDAVLRIPGTSHCCVLEWKLGQTSPELDLAQACLYHMLLEGTGETINKHALAVVSFHPQRQEKLFTQQELTSARQALMDAIGTLAGVSGSNATANANVNGMRTTEKPRSGKSETGSPTTDTPNGIGNDRLKLPPPVPPVTIPLVKPNHVDSEWLKQTEEKILRTLRSFSTPCRSADTPIESPAFVRFRLLPQQGIKSSKVSVLAQELKLHLGLAVNPVISIVEGMICIDIPRRDRQSISFAQVIPELPALKPMQGSARIPVGIDINGNWQWMDLADSSSAHALVCGTPGSGKSQWLRAALASLVMTNTPETLQLLLIDPKQNAFTFMKGSPFLSQEIVVPGEHDVAEVLEKYVAQMQQRNAQLAAIGSQNLNEHIRSMRAPFHRTVIICDEYADLLASCPNNKMRKELEQQFIRIAQVGRAPGFHMILATQQPRATVLSKSITALIPSKVVLRVTEPLESRVAMDQGGAESLLGNGDLYYKCIGSPTRLQGLWLTADEEHEIAILAQSQQASVII